MCHPASVNSAQTSSASNFCENIRLRDEIRRSQVRPLGTCHPPSSTSAVLKNLYDANGVRISFGTMPGTDMKSSKTSGRHPGYKHIHRATCRQTSIRHLQQHGGVCKHKNTDGLITNKHCLGVLSCAYVLCRCTLIMCRLSSKGT